MSFWKNLKRKKNKVPSIKLCPQCHKPTLYREITGWAATEHYKCKECDYSGAFYLEIEKNETGENFMDLENLKEIYPEDVDPESDLDVSSENLTAPERELKKKSEENENSDN